MEAIVRPQSWNDWPETAQRTVQMLRSATGERMILEENMFVENQLPRMVLRGLTDAEMAEYRRPFAEPGEGRRPTLTWPRQLPIEDQPADVTAIVQAYADWLAHSTVPKLFINADPGASLSGALREFCHTWPAQTEVTVFLPHLAGTDRSDRMWTALSPGRFP